MGLGMALQHYAFVKGLHFGASAAHVMCAPDL